MFSWKPGLCTVIKICTFLCFNKNVSFLVLSWKPDLCIVIKLCTFLCRSKNFISADVPIFIQRIQQNYTEEYVQCTILICYLLWKTYLYALCLSQSLLHKQKFFDSIHILHEYHVWYNNFQVVHITKKEISVLNTL